ncbi:hypothetical protein [Streptomyces olivoreticuli]|uniref:hypothetical protein n=1 Tax=Streptomyces olivoreticuli TaxID=68246 RepID=UPI000E2480BF|nr:hypothetical protein [Streptomyces olivoreticuli]
MVLALSGCSQGEDTQARPAPSLGPGADPSTWTLPMLAYRPTQQQDKSIATAETRLVRQCMKGFGVDWEPEPDLPQIGPKNLLDWRYGIHDPELTAKRGYQPDAAQEARYSAAVRDRSTRPALSVDTQVVLGGTDMPADVLDRASTEVRHGTSAGRKLPPGGCFGEARRNLGSATHGVSPLVQKLTNASYGESQNDPQVKTVFTRWSACMRARGFTYAAPMEANDNPRFRPHPGGIAQLEISTALADLTCRDTYKVAEVWHEAETRIQRGYIQQNAAALAEDRRTLQGVVRTASEVNARA